MKDLTGVVQSDLLRQRQLPNKAKGAKLKAIRYVRSDPKLGRIWETECECGNHREVPAAYFKSGRILKCESCVLPSRAVLIPQINQQRAERREQFYPRKFRREWRSHFTKFNVRERLLFETIMDNRRRCPALEMQAVDLVIRARPDIEWELDTFSDARVERAKERLRGEGIETD